MFEVVILIAIPDLSRAQFDTLLPLVSKEKQERIKRYGFFRDARNALLGDLVSRVEICRATGLRNDELKFSTNEFGKPFLQGNPHIYHNISHAGHFVACAVSDKPVGIDIETIRPIDMKIAERFFTPDESAYIFAGQQTRRFFEVWTKKESRIKWEGKGMSKPLPSFSVFDPPLGEEIAYHEVFQSDEAVCHVCSGSLEQPSVRVVDPSLFMVETGGMR